MDTGAVGVGTVSVAVGTGCNNGGVGTSTGGGSERDTKQPITTNIDAAAIIACRNSYLFRKKRHKFFEHHLERILPLVVPDT